MINRNKRRRITIGGIHLVIVTLIGEKQARVGGVFVYNGSLPECKECRLKTVCFNLEKGKRYKVISVRDVKHDCRIHEEAVRVVEVEQVPTEAAVRTKHAIEGSTITVEHPPCKNVGCKNWRLCRPINIKKGDKGKILRVKGDVECEEGHGLKSVEIE